MTYVSGAHEYFQNNNTLTVNGQSVLGAYSDGSAYSSTFGTVLLTSSSFTQTLTPGSINITATSGSSAMIAPTAFSFNNPSGALATLNANVFTLASNINSSSTVVSLGGISVTAGSGASVSITNQFQLANSTGSATGTFSSLMLALNLANGSSFTYQGGTANLIGVSGTGTTSITGTSISVGTLTLGGGTAINSFGSSLNVSSNALQVTYGTGVNTAAQGNDVRITGALQSANLPASAALLGSGTGGSFTAVSVGTLGLAITSGVLNPTYGTSVNTFAQGNDGRITGAYQSGSLPVNAALLASGAAGTITAILVPAASGLSISAGTLSVVYGTAASTAAQGNDTRITGALQSANLPTNSALLASSAAGTFTSVSVGTLGLSITSGVLNPTYGTAVNTFAQGNDTRITGALQSTNLPANSALLASGAAGTFSAVSVGTLGIAITAGVLNPTYGTTANTFAQGDDTRITGAYQSANVPTSALLLSSNSGGTLTPVSIGPNLSILSNILAANSQVSVTGQDVLVYSGGNLSATILDPYSTSTSPLWYAARPQADSTTVTATSVSGTTGQLFALPIEVRQRAQIKAIACRVTTAGVTSSVRMGIYSNAGGTLGTMPLTLLVDGGSVSTGATGAAMVTILSGPTLKVGTYHLAIEIVAQGSTVAVFSGAAPCPELTSIYGATSAVISLGSTNAAGIQAGNGAVNTGALPSTFPTPTVLTAAAAPLLAAQLLVV